MDHIKIGVGVIVRDGNKILLGHRCKDKEDTGGIIGRDTWSLPGGKQEFNETFYDAGIREVKEETNLDIANLKLLTACDDFGDNRHFITLTLITDDFKGELTVTEPTKNDEWKWFDIDDLPDNLYGPSINSIKAYKEDIYGKGI